MVFIPSAFESSNARNSLRSHGHMDINTPTRKTEREACLLCCHTHEVCILVFERKSERWLCGDGDESWNRFLSGQWSLEVCVRAKGRLRLNLS